MSYQQLIDANACGVVDVTSQEILDLEKRYIDRWRETSHAGRGATGSDPNLSALALSGGGIRSATFALGVTQAFAARDLMCRFDYLSTVSGGGYLGSSLTWLTRKGSGFTFGQSKRRREDSRRFPYPVDPPSEEEQAKRVTERDQDEQLIYLREHGKYLTPGKGINLLSAVAVALRGLLLNLLVWMPLAALTLLVLMLPFGFWPDIDFFGDRVAERPGYALVASVAAALAAFFVVLSVAFSLGTRFLANHRLAYVFRRGFERLAPYILTPVIVLVPIALMPLASDIAREWLWSSGFVGVVAGLASAVRTFIRSRAGATNEGWTMSVLAPVGALLMLYGLLVLAYLWAESFYMHATFSPAFPWLTPKSSAGPLWPALPILAGVSLVTGWVVNVNLVSLHRYYRDRLMEAFLPDAPEAKKRNGRFTGWAKSADVGRLHGFANPEESPTGPYHLLNTNVILVNSKEWHWRTRGGDSFILSPLFCGSNATGWRCTAEFSRGSLTLATAMAISGAAANPYAGGGLFRNRPVAVLMSLVNLRLGYWVSHPDPGKWFAKRHTHFGTALRELFGKLNESSRQLQLSDGGHFDNLGIYELIRRRVRLIVACDGTADPEFAFSDFITLLARIEADFGARIRFNEGAGLEVFVPTDAAGYPRNAQLAKQGFTVGRITYSDGSSGDLIYITTTLFKGLGLQTMGYRAANPDFPDQSTADQFFDEAQFEAYRQLGYSVGEAVLSNAECCTILNSRIGTALQPPKTQRVPRANAWAAFAAALARRALRCG